MALINGLIIGTVTENYNKDYPGMVRVSYPSFSPEGNVTAWMPVASGYAGKNYGVYTLPEKEEQVIVGFIGGDAHSGVVLGSLWNEVNTIPQNTADQGNLIKRAVTKGGHAVTLKDGDEGYVTVKSKGGHTVEIDDKAETVTVITSDKGQKLVLDGKNKTVSLESGDKLNIKAKTVTVEGTLTLKGPSVTVEADNALTMKGKQVKIDGSTVKINGQNAELTGANVKAESSGILTLKGSLVKIN